MGEPVGLEIGLPLTRGSQYLQEDRNVSQTGSRSSGAYTLLFNEVNVKSLETTGATNLYTWRFFPSFPWNILQEEPANGSLFVIAKASLYKRVCAKLKCAFTRLTVPNGAL